MNVLIWLDTVAVALLSLLVFAVLRSHAELIRRTEQEHEAEQIAPLSRIESIDRLPLPDARPVSSAAFDVIGATLDGGSAKVSLASGEGTALLAFLSSGCLTCQAFWHGLSAVEQQPLPGDARVVVVTKDRDHESPTRLRDLKGTSRTLVILSSKAWEDYKVDLSPYFIYVDSRSGQVLSEGAATSWDQVISLLRDSFDDLRIMGAAAPGSQGGA